MTPSDILEEFRVVLASLPLARDATKTFRRYAGRERFSASAASRADSFHVESRTHEFLEGFGADGQSESQMHVAVLLGHSPSGTEAQREDWAARECAMVADVLERRPWGTPGVGAVFLEQPASTDRSDGDAWVSELLFRVVYVTSDVPAGDLPGYTPPPVKLAADHVTVEAIDGLEAADVQAALALMVAQLASAVRTTGDQIIEGLKTFVAGLVLQAKLSITAVPSGENAIEIPAGSRVQLGDGANGYLYGAGNTIITPGAISAAQVTLATTTGIVATTWASIRGNYAPAALRVGSLVALTGNILELYSDSFATLKAYFDKNGGLHTAASIVPITDGVGSLGSITNKWLEAYATNFRGTNLVDLAGEFRVRFGNGAPTQVIGTGTDGSGAIGVTLDSKNAFATSGAKIVSFRNGGAEKAYVDKDGGIGATWIDLKSSTAVRFLGNTVFDQLAAGTLRHRSIVANAATAVGHRFVNSQALIAAGAKLASFYSDDSVTERLFIDKDGQPEVVGAGLGVILKSPNGTRYKLTVADDGSLTTTAV